MSRDLSILFLTLFYPSLAMGQLVIKVQPMYRSENLVLDEKEFVSSNNDTLTFSTFKFYLTNLKVHFSDGTFFSEKNSCHLVDMDHAESLLISLQRVPSKRIQALEFLVGVDSIMNVSGALTGDLDPIKGMYWAWNTGYIHLKLAGKSSR
ncbi:MAG: hypothetical protein K2Q22_03995, partial [Cytophagales bacterium]|nr:hypothetical protein [Cytophagales bacterium]